MTGLTWLNDRPGAFCLTFVRGASERDVLGAFAAGPAKPAPARGAVSPNTAGPPVLRVGRAGQWLFALEETALPQGTRPEVLRRLSQHAEAVMIFRDIGKGNHEFAHALNGEILAALTASVPPHWRGSDPGRLIPLANELGLGPDGGDELTPLEALLALAEGVFGLSLDEADIRRSQPAAPIAPPSEPQPKQHVNAPPGMRDAAPVRAHVQRLVEAGMDPADIAVLGGMTPVGIDLLLHGTGEQILASSAERLLGIAPP